MEIVSDVTGPILFASKTVMVGCDPNFTKRSKSPVPPEETKRRLVAPAGTVSWYIFF
jgi:hypothetical protein